MILDNVEAMFIASSLVDYDKNTGVFTWRQRASIQRHAKHWNTRFANKECGTINNHGHRRLEFSINGERFRVYAHRLAFFIVHGAPPAGDIDHINRNPSDNRIENLRDVPHSINLRNRYMQKNNSSGVTGVYWYKRKQKWKAAVKISGKNFHLGYFHEKDDANKVVSEFRSKNGFTDIHGNHLPQNA